MKFVFTEEQEMLRDMIRGALQREVGLDKVRRWIDAGELSAFNTFLNNNDWNGIGIPEDAQGQGGGLVEQAILFEEIGRGGAPGGALLARLGGAAGFVSRVAGGFDRVRELTGGRDFTVLAVPAGSCVDTASQHVVQAMGKLTGKVALVLHAPDASHFVVPVDTGDGLDLWLLDAKCDGLQLTPRRLIDRTRMFGDITLHQVAGKLIGHISQAAASLANASQAVLLAAESLGLARRMLAMTVEYVSQRVQFGVPVGSFQAVKHAAAEALVEIEAAHSGVYYAAWALQEGEADGVLHAWMAKAFATEAAVRTADRALQLHGAIGYTWEYDLQLFYKRAKLNMELGGSPRSYRERIANALELA